MHVLTRFQLLGITALLVATLSGCGTNKERVTSTPDQFILTVSGNGSGTVTSTPAGINCGTTCRATFAAGTSVSLAATPDPNDSFAGWSGACSGAGKCTVVLNADTSVGAAFSSPASMAVALTGSGTGTVTSNPAGLNCPQTCTANFAPGTAVTLSAAPAADSTFAGWSGACSGSDSCTVTVSDSGTQVMAAFGASIQAINHIIVMLQENRSFDNYFGKLNDYRVAQGLPADVDGLSPDASNPSFDGTSTVSVYHLLTMCAEDSSPAWNESHVDFNRYDPTSDTGLMDGFVYTAAKLAQDDGLYDSQGLRVMGYYDEADIPYYYFLATQFATSDRWFSPVPSNSPANHMYLFAGTSAGHVYNPTSTLSNKTIFQMLEENGHSWKIYETDNNITFLSLFQPFAQEHAANLLPVSQFFTDLANNNLPAVSLIEAGMESGEDEHPGSNIQMGAADVAQLINALMNSESWKDSVFILSWDEAGGLYDHVAYQPAINPDGILPVDLQTTDICYGQPCGDFIETGGRLPLLVISPFVKQGYVSHTVADYTAILKFIETRFGLLSLTKRDAAQPDMLEFFDFANAPNRNPPALPIQPTDGPCYFDHLP